MSSSYEREEAVRRTCRALVSLLDEFRRYEPDISAGSIQIFMVIAAKPGIHFKEIERVTNLSSSAVHRNIRMMSDQHWRKDEQGNLMPGHDLVVAMPDAFDNRARVAMLTPRGRKVLEMALASLETKENE